MIPREADGVMLRTALIVCIIGLIVPMAAAQSSAATLAIQNLRKAIHEAGLERSVVVSPLLVREGGEAVETQIVLRFIERRIWSLDAQRELIKALEDLPQLELREVEILTERPLDRWTLGLEGAGARWTVAATLERLIEPFGDLTDLVFNELLVERGRASFRWSAESEDSLAVAARHLANLEEVEALALGQLVRSGTRVTATGNVLRLKGAAAVPRTTIEYLAQVAVAEGLGPNLRFRPAASKTPGIERVWVQTATPGARRAARDWLNRAASPSADVAPQLEAWGREGAFVPRSALEQQVWVEFRWPPTPAQPRVAPADAAALSNLMPRFSRLLELADPEEKSRLGAVTARGRAVEFEWAPKPESALDRLCRMVAEDRTWAPLELLSVIPHSEGNRYRLRLRAL